MTEFIKSLNEKDRVRKKISIWLGSNSHNAVIHVPKELIGNAVDLVVNGNGDTIKVTLLDNKTICIEDNCKGLPVEGMGSKEIEGVGKVDIPNYQLLTAHLFAGTKYENGLNGNEQYTVGCNGVFLTVLSRASEWVKYEVARPDGNIYSFSYNKGYEDKPLTIIGKSDTTYTKITYKLDDEIFVDNSYTFEELCEIAKQQASLINGTIAAIDVMNNKETTFRFNDGIGELLSMYVGDKQSLHPLIRFQKQIEQSVIIENKEEIDKVIIDLALQYTIEDNENCQIDFLNGSNLVNHGTINDGMSWGLRTAFNKFIKDNGMYKKNESEINWQDAEYGLNYVCNVKSFFPIYANQTKLSTDVGYYKTLVRKMVEEYFEIFSLQNKEIMMKLAQKVLANKHIREITEQSRSKAKKKLDEKLTVMTKPEKYVDCRSKDKNVRELYLVEGDSALGSCKQGRDKNIQALFPVKGKILNCLKQADEKIFNNDIILDLIKIFGCGVEKRSKFTKDLPRFDEDNIQWDKIIIMSDQDDDGFQIRTLVLTAIYVICPSLIKLGKVYVVDSPLHIIESGGKTYFAYSDKEKFDILSKLKGSFKTSRSKGLGENDADMLWQTSMNPQTRKLTKITVDDIVLMNETFELFLGDNLDGRKEYIEQYGDNYVDFSVFGL